MKLKVIEGSKRKRYYRGRRSYEWVIDATCIKCEKVFRRRHCHLLTATGKCGSCRTTTHGKYGIRAYWAWAEMKKRCDNPKQVFYYRYGGRGITYQDNWAKFENFYKDMGDCPDKKELDRIDNNGNYEKGNCRWVTHKENCNNRYY